MNQFPILLELGLLENIANSYENLSTDELMKKGKIRLKDGVKTIFAIFKYNLKKYRIF